jgi:hypothetical protein
MKLHSEIKDYFEAVIKEMIIFEGIEKPFFRTQKEAKEFIQQQETAFVFTDTYNGRIINNWENANKTDTFPLVILFRHEKNDFQAQQTAVDNAFKVFRTILSRMVIERSVRIEGKLPIEYFDTSSVNYTEVNDVFDGYSGMRINLSLMHRIDFSFDEEEWITPDQP